MRLEGSESPMLATDREQRAEKALRLLEQFAVIEDEGMDCDKCIFKDVECAAACFDTDWIVPFARRLGILPEEVRE